MLIHNRILLLTLAILPSCWTTTAHAGWKSLSINRKQAKQQLKPRKIALVIGINQTRAKYWSPLLYAKRDALRMAKALQQLARFDHIVIRTQKIDTTQSALWESIKSLRKRVRSPLDTVVVYVSAHGTIAYNPKNKQQERYIVTSDTNQHTAKTAINVRQLVTELKGLASKRAVLMLATCYTGSPQSKSQVKPGKKGVLKHKKMKPLQDKALQILSAAGFAQAAFESTKLKSDVYTHFFLKCLHKLKKNKKNISTIDAHVCAAQPTTQFVKRTLHEIQVPRVDSRPGANRDVFLVAQKRRKHVLGYFWAGRKSQNVRYELRKDNHTKGVQQSHWADPGEYIGVHPGRYTVTIRDRFGRAIRHYTITIRREHTTHLYRETYRDPYDELETSEHPIYEPTNPLVTTGYVMGLLIVAGGGTALIHGLWTRTEISTFSGGMLIGAGSVVVLCSLAIDFGLRANRRRIRYLRSLSSKARPQHIKRQPHPSQIIPPPPGYSTHQIGSFH